MSAYSNNSSSNDAAGGKMFLNNWKQKAEEFRKRAKEKVELVKDKIEEQKRDASSPIGKLANRMNNQQSPSASSPESRHLEQKQTPVSSSSAGKLVNRMDSLELNAASMNAEQAAKEVDKLHPGFFEPYRKDEDEDETNRSEERINASTDPSSSSSNNDSIKFDALRESLKEIPRDFSPKDLRREEERLMAIVETVQTRINGEIYKKRNEVGHASQKILDIQNSLTRANVVLKNGRRALERSQHAVDVKIRAVHTNKRKENMVRVLRVVEELRRCGEREISIREKIGKGDISAAIVEYGEAKNALEALSALDCTKQAIEDLNLLKFEVERGTRDAFVQAFSTDEDGDSLYEKAFQGALALGHERAAELSAECFATARDSLLVQSQAEDPVGGVSRAAHLLFKRLHFAKAYHEKKIAMANKNDAFETLLADSLAKSNLEARTTDTAYHALNALEIAIRTDSGRQNSSATFNADPNVARMTLRKCRLFADMCEKFAGAETVYSRTKSLMDCAIDVLSDAQRKPRLGELKLAFERETWTKLSNDLAKKARAEARMASSIEERVGSTNGLIMNADDIDHQSKEKAMRAIDWVERREHPFAGERFVGSDDAVLKMTTNEENLLLSPQESSKMMNDSDGNQMSAVAAMAKLNGGAELSAEHGKEEDASTSKTVTASTAYLLESVRVFASLAAESPTMSANSKCRSKLKAFDACREMFELALFNVFVSFGNPRLLVHTSGQLLDDHNKDALTNRLKQTLTKLASRGGLFALKPPPPIIHQQQQQHQHMNTPGDGSGGNNPNGTAMPSASSAAAASTTTPVVSKLGATFRKRSQNARAQIASSGNMFGLKERVVALESLACVASIYEELKPTFERWVGEDSSSVVDKFFTKVVHAVDDLREHILSRVAELLLDLSWLPDEIGDSDFKITDMQSMKKAALGKYNQKEMPSVLSASEWTTQLGQVLAQFATKLRVSEVTAVNGKILWELGAQLVSNAIVRGFAKVKKCSVDGRAIMQMDVQTVQQHFQTHYPFEKVPPPLNLDFRYVETYIKAFYTQESELVRWTMIHPEYTSEQKLVLVSHVAHAFKWTSKQKLDCLSEIQNSDLV
jgi:hypothetical protein|tara:strand:- start:97 stop:3387 length:3291 start_codon:yes stop_codon:yes gene_type:complete